jgi:hypothetical protein
VQLKEVQEKDKEARLKVEDKEKGCLAAAVQGSRFKNRERVLGMV